MNRVRVFPSMTVLALIAIATFTSIVAHPVQAQTTLSWASPGIGPNIGDGGNWVGGVAPNFATDATSDSAIFSASTNTAVKLRDVMTGDSFATVTFDATAPAYTFSLPTGNTTNDLVILPGGNMTNSSGNTQTFTALPDISINSAPATVGKLAAVSGNAGTGRSFDLNQLKFNNAGGTGAANISQVDLTAGADVRTGTINGVANAGVSSTLNVLSSVGDGTGGTLFITGDSGTNTGRLVIGTGAKVQISNNNSLGIGGSTTTDETRIGGGGTNNGRLELTGNITVNEGFVLGARQNGLLAYNNHREPAILNVSETNTITGPFAFGGGGNAYTFGSNSGTLIIQSDLSPTTSFDRYLNFLGTGNINVTGNIIGGTGSNLGVPIVKFDSGTTTLNGSANNQISQVLVYDGTLALGVNAAITFEALATDTETPEAPRVHIGATGKFDVSAIAGGYTLTQNLQGSGTVVGSLAMASGTQVLPGGTVAYYPDSQNFIPFNFPDAVGHLAFQSSLDLSAGAQMTWNLGSLSTSNPGIDFDQIAVGGNLKLGGTSSLSLDFSLLSGTDPNSSDPFWTANHTWKIIDAGGNTGSTNFATLVGGGAYAHGSFSTSVGATPAITGDANSDGVVDIFDVNLVSAHWSESGPAGDVNGDLVVDIFDVNMISANWANTGPVGNLGDILLNYTASGAATAVPEPASCLLLSLGALAMFVCMGLVRTGLVGAGRQRGKQ